VTTDINADASPHPSRTPWSLVALLVAAMVVCYAHRGALSVAAPFMMKDLGLSPAAMGLLLSAFFWLYAFMQVPAGWVVDRFGVKWAYAAGFAFWSIAAASTGFAAGIATLVGLRLALGAGQSVAFPASASAVARAFRDRERGLVTASYLSGVRMGQAIVGAIGAVMILKLGYRGFFLTIGLIAMVWLLPWLRFWKNRESDSPLATGAAAADRFSFAAALALLRRRSVIGIFLGFFAFDYAWFVYVTWLPSYLVMGRKFTTAEMGFYSSVPYLIMMVVILLSGALSDWLVRRGQPEVIVRKSFITAGMSIAFLIVPAALVENRLTSVWLMTASLAGLGITTPNSWTLTQAVCARRIVGTVSGIQNFGGNLGGIVAPAFTGFTVSATGSFVVAFAVSGVVLVIGILCYWLLVSSRVTTGD
jgi:MFS family permease